MGKPVIGFIGLGLMGSAMVSRLQGLGYRLNVIAHRHRANVDEAIGRGAREFFTARELARASDIIMLCVDSSASVEAMVYGEDGVLAGVRPGTLAIDFGTSLPGSTRKIGADMAARQARYMDAPLGRTPAHAVDGLLNIMAAGEREDFEAARPVLQDLGENVFHVGPLGAGHTLKLINNFFALTTACAMSEAFAMADLAGLPRQKLYDVMASGPNRSGMMDFIKAYAIDGDPQALAFSVANASKDVGYYVAMADDFGAPSQISPAVRSTLEKAAASGWSNRMVPELVSFFEQLFAEES